MLLSVEQELNAVGDKSLARGRQNPDHRRVYEHLQIRARSGLLEVRLQDMDGPHQPILSVCMNVRTYHGCNAFVRTRIDGRGVHAEPDPVASLLCKYKTIWQSSSHHMEFPLDVNGDNVRRKTPKTAPMP